MTLSILKIVPIVIGLLSLSGCSSLNETLWHSLKSRETTAHPSMEQTRASERPMSYDEYGQARKKTIQ